MTNDRIAVTVDFEYFTHTPAYKSATGDIADRTLGIDAASFLLETLAERDSIATFFVVSEVAERNEEVVRAIADAGHEIGSHGVTHTRLSTLARDEQRVELQASRETLETVSGEPVSGFRAPVFDISRTHFEDVDRAGYEYDSSIVPARRIPGWYGGEFSIAEPVSAATLRSGSPDIPVIPVSVFPWLRLPLTGAWVRLLGRRYAHTGIRWLLENDVTPVLYLHPWELVDLPSVEGVPARVTWRTGRWMRETVKGLLDVPAETVTCSQLAAGVG